MKRIVFVLLVGLFGSMDLMAQGVYDDFIYTRQAVQERKVVPWPYLREADVHYAKRIWRVIDMREKQNQPMQWPKNPLNIILYNAVMGGKLIPYKDDSLSSSHTTEEFEAYFAQKKPEKQLIDPNGDPDDPTNFYMDTVEIKLEAKDIKKFKIMEDWIFDKKESRMYVRIIGIALLVQPTVEGAEIPEQEWCWLKYHRDPDDPDQQDLREMLVNMEVFNRVNDAARITYDDWFEGRWFSSYIVKQANQYDNAIKDFAEFQDNGVAALLEAEKIKSELFEFEHDLWEY
ncbi:MAG: gliding motility protein GldN [Bacteroidia bacterium]|jgi:gliding motility associated protien GldN